MPRLSNEQLKTWALRYSSAEKGACHDVTTELMEANFANFDGEPPTTRSKKGVRIELREKTAHVGLLLRWNATNEEVIVDATIQQFGGDERVFVGSYADWIIRLKALTSAQKVEDVDADFGFMYDILDDLQGMSATELNDQRRSVGNASSETRQAQTLKKGCGCTIL